ncbi:hypothetical protein ACFYT4_34795 [Streptomyces sp. NPDC004609]
MWPAVTPHGSTSSASIRSIEKGGQWRDSVVHAVLDSEWASTVSGL